MAVRRSTVGVARSFLRASNASSLSTLCRAETRWTSLRTAAPATRTLAATRVPSSRWYSVKNDPDAIPGSTEWDFDMVKTQAETQNKDIVLVDVREPRELHETGKIPGAINVPITTAIQSFHISAEDFADMYGFDRPAKDKELIFYCKAGIRAKTAAGLAKHAGWEKVGVYYGSWLDWEKGAGPVEKVDRKHGVMQD